MQTVVAAPSHFNPRCISFSPFTETNHKFAGSEKITSCREARTEKQQNIVTE
jgi:hypothetical protein